MVDSQDRTKSSNKRRRLHQSGSGHNGDDNEVISVYSDSSNDGGNLSSNASSPESAKMDHKKFLTGPQQNSEGANNNNEALSSQSSIHPKNRAAHDATNNNDTDKDEEYFSTACRTVQVPNGVTEGQLFHVLIIDNSTHSNSSNDNIIGAICPKGAKAGDTILIIEPESSPPLSPQQIATINEQRLFKGIDPQNAKWEASSFWKIVWPTLVEEGWWCQKQSLYNFGSVTFYSPSAKRMLSDRMLNQEYFESISAVLGYPKLPPGLVQMCYAYADAAKRRKKSVEDAAAAKAGASRRSFSALDRWKYPTGIGALKHSRVGGHYQAQSLPEVGTFAKGEDGCILEPIVNIQEQDNVNSTWREWANDEAFSNEFHRKILEVKKQFRILAASLDKPIGFCLWYYYCKYKTSANYVTLKNLLRGNSNESGEHLDECVICDDGGDLICCDSCPNAYHLSCLGLKTIEDEIEWFCPDCTEERTRNLSPRKFAPSPTKKTPAAAAPPDEASTAARQLVV